MTQVKTPIGNRADFRPSMFMRARRPELFSDSQNLETPRLTKEIFEYHLNTLTSRKQETEFEHFCKKLAEKEICPNLLPQTGPTGGGDSKVDSETYPVADSIADRWYVGEPRNASTDRWAFAFSAKKTWQSKVKEDVKKICDTGRDYKLIYFVTNQYVKDSKRAQFEGNLHKTHNVEVRILDRKWIVEKVFDNKRFDIAIETLQLEGFEQDIKRIVGPKDVERELELAELEKQIDNPDRYRGLDYQLAEDCLLAALLARGLERPRVEVDGRFDRAARIANKVGIKQQQLRVLYNKTWTAFWWYDDFNELNRLYDEVEQLAVGSDQAYDLERLTNLWTVLNSAVSTGSLDSSKAKLVRRTSTLEKELERLSEDQSRPTNALRARVERLLMDVHRSLLIPNDLDTALVKINSVFVDSRNLSTFPLEPVIQIVRILGAVIVDNQRYDEVLENVIKVAEERKSEGEAGRILLQRGYQKLRARKKYDALRLFGRAQRKLAKEEYNDELVAVLAGTTSAYEGAGLLWAARVSVLAAINQSMVDFFENGNIHPRSLKYLMRMVWIELQLGRIPCALSWMDVAHAIAQNLMLDDDKKEAFLKERQHQDIVLGLLFLKVDFWELKWLDFLPAILSSRRLSSSRFALLYALGYEGHLRSQQEIPSEQDSAAVKEMFRQWLGEPVVDDLPERPELLAQRKATFRSYVLGCEVSVETDNNLETIYLAETILGILEGLLATSLGEIFPTRGQFRVIVRVDDRIGELGKPDLIHEEGTPVLLILHPQNISYQTEEQRDKFRLWLFTAVALIVAYISRPRDLKTLMKNAFTEDVFDRAMNFADLKTLVENILGTSPRYAITDWEKECSGEKFPLKRDLAWNHGLAPAVVAPESLPADKDQDPEELEIGKLFGFDKMKHRDQKVFDLIEDTLWDKAKWSAMTFFIDQQLEDPPVLGIAFTNKKPSELIFQGWLKRMGSIDKHEQLRISIVTGINKENPASYAVVIGGNLRDQLGESKWKRFVVTSRIHRMNPANGLNLERFLSAYRQMNRYILAPAIYHGENEPFELGLPLGIEKTELNVVEAWRLTQSDPELSAIEDQDAVIVPDGVTEVPLFKALKGLSRSNPNSEM